MTITDTSVGQNGVLESLAEYYEMVEALGEELSLTITVTVFVAE